MLHPSDMLRDARYCEAKISGVRWLVRAYGSSPARLRTLTSNEIIEPVEVALMPIYRCALYCLF